MDGRRLRRGAVPLRLAAARVRRRPERALVAAGVAGAAAALAALLASGLTAQDRSLARRVDELPDAARAVRAVWFGVPGETSERYSALDRRARSAVAPVVEAEPVRTVLFRESTIAGRFIGLGAVDGLDRWIRLRSGRLPAGCTPRRCEVVRLRGEGRLPSAPGLRLVEVGRGALRSGVLFGDAVPPDNTGTDGAELSPHIRRARGYHRPPPAPLVLAEGAAGLLRSPALATLYRSYGWIVPLSDVSLHPWSLEATLSRLERARSSLGSASAGFELTAASEELAAARDAGRTSGRRLLLLGGQAVALLLAFAILAGSRARADTEGAFRRLTWLGAGRWQLGLLAAGEAALVVVPGALAGWAAGVAIAAAVASGAGVPAGAVVAHSVLSPGGVALAFALALGATLALVLATAVPPLRAAGLSLTPLDVTAAAAAAVVATTLARGETNAETLARERGTGVLLLLLPGLVAAVVAVAAARLLPLALRGLERLVPSRLLSLRLAALALARRPGHAAVAAAFLAVSIGLALFAESYRATLARGHVDQAAFAVPADVVLREDLGKLLPVRDVVTPTRLRSLAGRARVWEATRLQSSLGGTLGQTGITVLGVEPAALAGLDGWRGDFASRSPDELARLVAPDRPAAVTGVRLPASARRVAVSVRRTGAPIRLALLVKTTAGDAVSVELGTAPEGSGVLRAPVPEPARGGLLLAFRLDPPPRIVERGADLGRAAAGRLVLGRLAVDGRTLERTFRGWRGAGGVERLAGGGAPALRLVLANRSTGLFRPKQPTDDRLPPALVTPRLADLADDEGRLPVRLGGETVPFRAAAVVRRFPGIDGEAIVLDRSLLTTALDAARPGAGVTSELWLDARGREGSLLAELRRPPFDVLAADVRSEVLRRLETEPIARASLLLLAGSAVTALCLALVALALVVVGDLRDSRGELYDLETQGLEPALLRRQLRLRALAVALAGVVGGLAGGLVLATLTVDLVGLTAGAAAAEPPLVLTVDWSIVGAALLAGAALAALVLIAGTRGGFRAPTPARSAEGA